MSGLNFIHHEREAGDEPSAVASLRGLRRISVGIDMNSDKGLDLPTEETIRREVEEQLSRGGFEVFAPDDAPMMENGAVLAVKIETLLIASNPPGVAAFSVSLSIAQRVTLSRDPKMRLSAKTWVTGVLGVSISTALAQSCLAVLGDRLEKFVNVYQGSQERT